MPKKEENCNIIIMGAISYGLYAIYLYNFNVILASNQIYKSILFDSIKLLFMVQF